MADLPIIESCDGCGACCLEMESPPLYVYYLHPPFEGWTYHGDDQQRFEAMPEHLKDELRAYRETYIVGGQEHPNGGNCIWFDQETRQCRHHEWRPAICRDLEVGGDGCRSWRNKYAIEGE